MKRRFGAAAEKYVASADHARGDSLDRMIELVDPKPDWIALDVATGGGHTALALARRVREVVASDLTKPMLEAAERFIRGAGVTNVRFQEADAGALPFPDNAFDLVTCRIAPHHFPDCAGFVREAARVTRPGGIVAVIDNVVPEDAGAAAFVNEFEKIRDPSHNRAYTASAWVAFFEAAHLAILHKEKFRKARGFDAWIGRMDVDPPTRDRLRAMLRGAEGPARAALAPEEDADGALRFYLEELMILGRRAAR